MPLIDEETPRVGAKIVLGRCGCGCGVARVVCVKRASVAVCARPTCGQKRVLPADTRWVYHPASVVRELEVREVRARPHLVAVAR